MDDRELLRQFVRQGSHAAFEALVRRHVDLVHSAALRQLRDAAAAQDVTQQVFITLAAKAWRLSGDVSLVGWLFKTTHFTVLAARKAQRRRRYHEQKAAQMKPLSTDPDSASVWDAISPHVDSAIMQLDARYRSALLLRYFHNKTGRQIASELGISEDAAKQRISRGLSRLRDILARRGVAVPTTTLAAALLASAVQPTPASAVAAVVAASSTVSASGTLIAALSGIFMATTKIKAAIGLGILLIAAMGSTVLLMRSPPSSSSRGQAISVQPAKSNPEPPQRTWPAAKPKPRGLNVEIPALSYDEKNGGREQYGFIGYIDPSVWIRFSSIDFADGAASQFRAKVIMSSQWKTTIILRLDRPDGPPLAELQVEGTTGKGIVWQSTPLLQKVEGTHDVYITFKGSGANIYAFSIDSNNPSSAPELLQN